MNKQKFIPSRANAALIDTVNKQRKKDQLTWPDLLEALFRLYLDSGLPQLFPPVVKKLDKK